MEPQQGKKLSHVERRRNAKRRETSSHGDTSAMQGTAPFVERPLDILNRHRQQNIEAKKSFANKIRK